MMGEDAITDVAFEAADELREELMDLVQERLHSYINKGAYELYGVTANELTKEQQRAAYNQALCQLEQDVNDFGLTRGE